MGPYHKIRSGIKILRHKITGNGIPLVVAWSLTDRCNLRCRYCKVWRRKTTELSADDIKRALSDAKKSGTERVGFTGGEPLMREDIAEIIEMSSSLSLHTSISTNGTMLRNRLDDILSADEIVVSIDGDKGTNDSLRGNGSFEKAMNGITAALESGMKVTTSTVLTSKNLSSIRDIAELSIKHGFSCSFQPIRTHPFSGDVSSMIPQRRELKKAMMRLIEMKKDGYPIANSESCIRTLMGGGISWDACMAGKLFCVIDTDGMMYPCFDLIRKVRGTNIMTKTFGQAFSSLGTQPCDGCSCLAVAEVNALASLDSTCIISAIRS